MTADAREWIIQRCTQQWIGHELQYQDWGPYGPGTMTPVTKAEMIEALEAFAARWPDDEFRGHNVTACRCHIHHGDVCLRRHASADLAVRDLEGAGE